MLPTPRKHLVLKHKSEYDFISKFKDVSSPKLCQHVSALQIISGVPSFSQACGKKVQGETSLGWSGREGQGIAGCEPIHPQAPSMNHPAAAAASLAADTC